MTASHISLGKHAEELACTYLAERNFRILGRNWRRSWGELDIIAQRERTLHFIEVKGERVSAKGFEAFRRANDRKLTKVIRTARTWLASHRRSPQTPWQVDIISVTVNELAEQAHITHFKNVTV